MSGSASASLILASGLGPLLLGHGFLGRDQQLRDLLAVAPKRLVGQSEDVILGELSAPVTTLIAAVLGTVRHTALLASAGAEPDVLRLTYPATWSDPNRTPGTRTTVLVAAAREAGFAGRIDLVREPVAAAIKIAAERVATGKPINEGERVAVYDLGGGTFDTAVLQRVDGGFKVLGEPGGLDNIGGDIFDQRIFEHLSRSRLGQHEHWSHLTHPYDNRWHRARAQLTGSIREAKEKLSRNLAARIWVPEINEELQLTRDELNSLIAMDIDATVEELAKTIETSQLTPSQLVGTFLVGASSRIPLVTETLWKRLGMEPNTDDDPKAVVALGATQWTPLGKALPSDPNTPETAPPGPESEEPRNARPAAPVLTSHPRLRGKPRVGHITEIENAIFAGPQPITFQYEWQRQTVDGVTSVISNAKGPKYLLATDDAGTAVRARISATNPNGTTRVATRWKTVSRRALAGQDSDHDALGAAAAVTPGSSSSGDRVIRGIVGGPSQTSLVGSWVRQHKLTSGLTSIAVVASVVIATILSSGVSLPPKLAKYIPAAVGDCAKDPTAYGDASGIMCTTAPGASYVLYDQWSSSAAAHTGYDQRTSPNTPCSLATTAILASYHEGDAICDIERNGERLAYIYWSDAKNKITGELVGKNANDHALAAAWRDHYIGINTQGQRAIAAPASRSSDTPTRKDGGANEWSGVGKGVAAFDAILLGDLHVKSPSRLHWSCSGCAVFTIGSDPQKHPTISYVGSLNATSGGFAVAPATYHSVVVLVDRGVRWSVRLTSR